MAEDKWYYEAQGERCGPVPFKELQQLVASERVQPESLTWKRGMAEWSPAGQIDGLFPPRLETVTKPVDAWYYGDGEQQHGPLSIEELKKFASSGWLQPDDLLWKRGMAEWAPAGQIDGLSPAWPEPPAQPAVPPADLWYSGDGEQRHGPVSQEELKRLASSGGLHPDDLVWNRGMAEWIPAAEVEGIFSPPRCQRMLVPIRYSPFTQLLPMRLR